MLADDRVSGTDADRHDAISRNGSSGFGGIADSAETGDLGDVIGEGGPAHATVLHHMPNQPRQKPPPREGHGRKD